MKWTTFFAGLLVVSFFNCMVLRADDKTADKKADDYQWPKEKGTYALIQTNKGDILVKLMPDAAPETVKNFCELAKGERQFIDVKNGKKVKRPFYDGLTFHRVIPDFMIQGGCPFANGTGGPGYTFKDEFAKGVGVDYGTLCMANRGPNTNGSQFFIVSKKGGCPWLNNRHTVFGKVEDGMSVVHDIESVKRGRQDKPLETVTIKTIKIHEVK